MARFTSIGMGRKTFVASAAEDRQASDKPADGPEAGPSKPKKEGGGGKDKKRGRKDEGGEGGGEGDKAGWGRDSDVAKRAKVNAQRSVERRFKRQNLNTTSTTCFACRSIGHAARDCPNVLLAAQGASNDGSAALLGDGEGEGGKPAEPKGMKRGKGKKGGEVTGGKCYRCDSTSHSLSHCPVKTDPSNPTPFATCFICLAKGHLSALCPNNTKGVYVKGGCCKVCGSVKHRANDCPDDKRGKRPAYDAEGAERSAAATAPKDVGADEDDFMVQSRVELANQAKAAQDKEKKKKAKHPPNNNGPRAKYNKQLDDQPVEGITTAALLEADKPSARPSVDVPADSVVKPAAPSPVPAPARAPAAVPAKRVKPKVVKF